MRGSNTLCCSFRSWSFLFQVKLFNTRDDHRKWMKWMERIHPFHSFHPSHSRRLHNSSAVCRCSHTQYWVLPCASFASSLYESVKPLTEFSVYHNQVQYYIYSLYPIQENISIYFFLTQKWPKTIMTYTTSKTAKMYRNFPM